MPHRYYITDHACIHYMKDERQKKKQEEMNDMNEKNNNEMTDE